MALQFGQVVEGIHVVELAGVDEAHEQVTDVGAVEGLVEQRVLSMKDCSLQNLFADVVVQGGSGLTQEERQLLPVGEQVRDGLAEGRVRLHEPLLELPVAPRLEFLHDRTALSLVELQARLP